MIFCVAGIDGTQNLLPRLLIQMAEEYCRAYECGWQLEEFYEVKKLLDKIRASHFRTGRQGNRVLSQRTGDGRSAKVVPSCQTYAEILVLSSGTGTRLTVFREEIQRDGNPGTILYSDNKTASLSHQGSRTRERWKSWRRKPNENI